MKWPGDLWGYQETMATLRPSLVVEFGTCNGGSALWFADTLERVNPFGKVLTVDIDGSTCAAEVVADPRIERIVENSLSEAVADRIRPMRSAQPGAVFAILDGDHSMEHVLAEMESLRDVLESGDVLIVEDSNINGHPVLPEFGPGPLEAIREYTRRWPADYERDSEQETKFGFTFAPEGWLRRR